MTPEILGMSPTEFAGAMDKLFSDEMTFRPEQDSAKTTSDTGPVVDSTNSTTDFGHLVHSESTFNASGADFSGDGIDDSFSFSSFTSENVDGSSTFGTSISSMDGATGNTTEFKIQVSTGPDGSVTGVGTWETVRDENGDILSQTHTYTDADGNTTVVETDEKGNRTETRTDKDGNKVDDGGFWDVDIIYGGPPTGQVSTFHFDEEQMIDTLGKEMTEAFVDTFDFFM